MSFESDLLRDSATRLFVDLFDRPSLDTRPRADTISGVWARFDEAGLPLAGVAEAHGGVGATLADAMGLVRLCGAHAIPAPLAETIVGGWVWSSLARAAPPSGPLTLAAGEMVAHASLTKQSSGGWRLDATLERVPWGRQANAVILATKAGDDAAVVCVPLANAPTTFGQNMALEPRDDIVFKNVSLPTSAVEVVKKPQAPSYLRESLALARAAQLSGAMATALDRTIAYANERVQFGKPIGKFQVIQQQLAMAAGEAAASQAAVDLAVALAGDADRFALAAAIAKARASEAAGIVASICHQTHAAIGFTNEHPLQLYTRRLWAWRDEAGAETYWQRKIGERLLAMDASHVWPLLTTLSPGL